MGGGRADGRSGRAFHDRHFPYLLEKDTVTLIEEDTVHLDGGMRVHVECSSELSLPIEEDFNILVKLPLAPWFRGELEASEEDRAWEAGQFDSTLVCVRAVGSQEGEVYAGGSTVHSPDGVLRAGCLCSPRRTPWWIRTGRARSPRCPNRWSRCGRLWYPAFASM